METITNSLEWLGLYIEDSSRFKPQFLVASTVIRILQPLVDAVPYEPMHKPLYRLVGADKEPTIPAGVVRSVTYAADKSHWKDIASQVGIDDFDVYAVPSFVQLTNQLWLSKSVHPWIEENLSPEQLSHAYTFLECTETEYQKEVIGFVKSPLHLGKKIYSFRW